MGSKISLPEELRDPWQRASSLRLFTASTVVESPRSSFGPFRLPHYGLAWVLEGGGVSVLDGTQVRTKPGTVLLLTPGMMLQHHWHQRSLQNFFVFELGRLPQGWPDRSRWVLSRHFAEEDHVFSLWRFALGLFEAEGAARAPLIVPAIELILRTVLTGQSGHFSAPQTFFPAPVERALAFMAEHYRSTPGRPLRGSRLAKRAGVTPQHLCRLFQRSLQLTPMDCANALRLELAAAQLEQTGDNLADIADRFGFSSPFHFSRSFKQSYGLPPSKYRHAFQSGRTVRPPGLMFRHHRLRRFLYEGAPGKLPESDS